MFTGIVIINTLIALILLYVAWQIQKLQGRLARIADKLSAYELSTHAALRGVPAAISKGRQGIQKLRRGNQPPDVKLQRVQQVLTLLGLGQQVWQRFFLVRRSQFFKKGLVKNR